MTDNIDDPLDQLTAGAVTQFLADVGYEKTRLLQPGEVTIGMIRARTGMSYRKVADHMKAEIAAGRWEKVGKRMFPSGGAPVPAYRRVGQDRLPAGGRLDPLRVFGDSEVEEIALGEFRVKSGVEEA